MVVMARRAAAIQDVLATNLTRVRAMASQDSTKANYPGIFLYLWLTNHHYHLHVVSCISQNSLVFYDGSEFWNGWTMSL